MDDAIAAGTGFTCPSGTDLIPNDIKPGDAIDLTATYTEFGPTSTTTGAQIACIPISAGNASSSPRKAPASVIRGPLPL